MEPQANTQTVKTPSGEHELVLKAYLTGADKRASRHKILDLTGGSVEESKVLEHVDAAEDALIVQCVISIDGSTEDIIKRVLEFKGGDYDFLIATINRIASGIDDKKKVTSDSNTPTSSTEEGSA